MKFIKIILCFISAGLCLTAFAPLAKQDEVKTISPENYYYQDVQFCLTCKTEGDGIMPRAIGIEFGDNALKINSKGWLTSGHAKALSHEKPINSYCARCHFPTWDNLAEVESEAKIIPTGKWQGVTCRACHSSNLERSLRQSTLINYKAGKDKKDPANYIFIDRKDGKQQNSQCGFCHEKTHQFSVEIKNQMLQAGDLRCIDCHMAGYKKEEYTVARFHNMKVKENIPWSCGSQLGNTGNCHHQQDDQWMATNISALIKK